MTVTNIEYYCDFCKTKITEPIHKFGDKIMCDDCYDHLTNQTWRYKTDSVEYLNLLKENKKLKQEKYDIGMQRALQHNAVCHELNDIKQKAYDFVKTRTLYDGGFVRTIDCHCNNIDKILTT